MTSSSSEVRLAGWRIAMVAALTTASGCESLPELTRNQCGNGIIEQAEDCDGAGIGANLCNAACRLACQEDRTCPDGWGCGADGICRQSSGALTAFGGPIGLTATQLATADFDGDLRDDLLAVDDASFSVAFLDAQGLLPGTITVASDHVDLFAEIPSAGDLDGDGRADLALRVQSGVGLLTGRADRTLLPVPFSQAPEGLLGELSEGAQLIVANVDERAESPGSEIVAVRGDGLYLVETRAPIETPLQLMAWPDDGRATFVTAESVIDLDESPGVELLVAREDDTKVTLLEMVVVTQEPVYDIDGVTIIDYVEVTHDNYDGSVIPPTEVTLPPGAVVSGPTYVGRIIGTNDADLLITGTGPDGPQLYVAPQLNQRQFTANPQSQQPGAGSRPFVRLDPSGAPITSLPLATGLFNDDVSIDFVDPRAVWVSDCADEFCNPDLPTFIEEADPHAPAVARYLRWAEPNGPADWTFARLFLVDAGVFDSFQQADLVVGTDEGGFTFFRRSVDDFLNPFFVPTQSGLENVEVGDYDGDGQRDLLFSQLSARADGDDSLQSLHIAFGDAVGIPRAPVDLGDVGAVDSVTTVVVADEGEIPDGINDFYVRARSGDETNLHLFRGSTDRVIQSPLDIAQVCAAEGMAGSVRFVAVGAFDEDPGLDIAVVMRSNEADQLWFFSPISPSAEAVCADLVGPIALDLPLADLRLQALDRNGDGRDELVVMPVDGVTDRLLVADAVALSAVEVALAEPMLGLAAADVDRNGFTDLLAWSATGLTLLPGDEAGFAAAVTVTTSTHLCDEQPFGAGNTVSAIQLDGDRELELLLFSDEHSLQLELSGGVFGPPECRSELFGGGATAAVSSDITGDGVDDVVLSRPGGTRVYAGVPVTP